MNDLSVNTQFATAAAREFTRRFPSYISNPHNSELMGCELARLVLEEGADPHSLETYRQAFSNLYEQLELSEPESMRIPDDMSPAELAVLSPREQEKLSDQNFRRLANFELEQQRKKPEVVEEDEIIRSLFEEQGFADSTKNRATIFRWLTSRSLDFSPANVRTAILECEASLAPSEQALSDMSSEEFRKAIVEPEFRKRQQAQPRQESLKPLGVKFTEWIQSR